MFILFIKVIVQTAYHFPQHEVSFLSINSYRLNRNVLCLDFIALNIDRFVDYVTSIILKLNN